MNEIKVSKLERYERTGCSDCNCMCGGTMEKEASGDWVLFDDVQRLVGQRENEIAKLKQTISKLEKELHGYRCESSGILPDC